MKLFSFLFKKEVPVNMDDTERDGSTPEKAIIVFSIPAEYRWLHINRPGSERGPQFLCNIGGKPYDVHDLTGPDGCMEKVYFDISSFFGK